LCLLQFNTDNTVTAPSQGRHLSDYQLPLSDIMNIIETTITTISNKSY